MMLSKSDFMAYNRCPCELWLKKVRPDLLPPANAELAHLFAEGNKVDAEAWRLFPDGVHVQGFVFDGWKETQKALVSDAETLFQPTAVAGKIHARADILTRNRSAGGWDIREVKSSTKVKDDHHIDLAFQKACFADAGVKIGKTWLTHINGRYVRHGAIDPHKLLVAEDITDTVRELVPWVRKEIPKALAVTTWPKQPTRRNYEACNDPTECEFLGYYLHELPPDVQDAARARRAEEPLPNPPVVRVDAAAVKRAIADLKFPFQFLDYETFSPAIPMFDWYRPYEPVTFQYSLHLQQKSDGELTHAEYLHEGSDDPAPHLARHLREHVLSGGTFVAWYARFEKSRNDEMAKRLPEFDQFFASVNDRMYDPIALFKKKGGVYFHSGFRGSASLKKVLPVLVPELAYSDLAIQKGDVASYSWPKLTDITVPAAERAQLRKDMLDYCGRDTLAMVKIMEHLDDVVRQGQSRLL